jgi:hypothetical protein
MPTVINIYSRKYLGERKQYKADGEIKDRYVSRELYENIEELRRREDTPKGFKDNNFDGGCPTDYTAMKSLAECIAAWYDKEFIDPAMRAATKDRQNEPKIDRPETDLGIKEVGPQKIKTKVCYYCGKVVYKKRLEDGMYTESRCEPCGVTYTKVSGNKAFVDKFMQDEPDDLPF